MMSVADQKLKQVTVMLLWLVVVSLEKNFDVSQGALFFFILASAYLARDHFPFKRVIDEFNLLNYINWGLIWVVCLKSLRGTSKSSQLAPWSCPELDSGLSDGIGICRRKWSFEGIHTL